MSETAKSAGVPSWQASLVSIEAQSLEIWRLGQEQVKQVQAKRQDARGAAARLAEAERRLAAGETHHKEADKLIALRKTLEDAKQGHAHALKEYEEALAGFHKQRTRLNREHEALSRRREALSASLPASVRQAYDALLGAGVPDTLAGVQDGRCAACGHDIDLDALRDTDIPVCPSCKRLIVQSNS